MLLVPGMCVASSQGHAAVAGGSSGASSNDCHAAWQLPQEHQAWGVAWGLMSTMLTDLLTLMGSLLSQQEEAVAGECLQVRWHLHQGLLWGW